jgi:hypothetical protein
MCSDFGQIITNVENKTLEEAVHTFRFKKEFFWFKMKKSQKKVKQGKENIEKYPLDQKQVI